MNIPSRSPEEHLDLIVKPAFDDFRADPSAEHRAISAASAAAHFCEWLYIYYAYHHPEKLYGAKKASEYRQYIIRNHMPSLAEVTDVADASKHRFLTNSYRVITSSSAAFLQTPGALRLTEEGRDFVDIVRSVVNFWEKWIK